MSDTENDTFQRLQYIYHMYQHDEIEHVLSSFARQTVRDLANEIVNIKTKYEEGGSEDTDENAIKTILAIVDEFADRVKVEVRFQIQAAKTQKNKEDEKRKGDKLV